VLAWFYSFSGSHEKLEKDVESDIVNFNFLNAFDCTNNDDAEAGDIVK